MAQCDCGRVRVDCAGSCGCACVTNGPCYVLCGGTIFGPLNHISIGGVIDLHTHGPLPLVDIVRLLNFAVKGGIDVTVPSSRFDEKVKLKMKGRLPEILKEASIETKRGLAAKPGGSLGDTLAEFSWCSLPSITRKGKLPISALEEVSRRTLCVPGH